ncbi:hypothetical protein Strain138_002612 [Pseudogemmatithrix spongiicola]|uniref:Lipoprotein n=1 Tax=Pseudogemmatithrix spongiicola TaxID=3062599 RepID=A0AA49JWQ9_9BACT|nr:hypothetical protein Strain138_002612 [Gemmatimonadaceae bacterium 'strain 138']WKW16202.1 hypothetical protein Strain318_002612 [Gemmatimonadaceae bacterium 'strain 318']
MLTRLLLLLLVAGLGGCYFPITRAHPTPLPFALESLARDTTIVGELRVTRLDGHDVIFKGYMLLGRDGVSGRGRATGPRSRTRFTPSDSIVRIVTVRREVRVIPTALATAAASTAAVLAVWGAIVSLFT